MRYPNIQSAPIRELAERLPKIELVHGDDGEALYLAAGYLVALAQIHEELSTYEFSSDTYEQLQFIFQERGMQVFENDKELNPDGLREKYGDEHPHWPKSDWQYLVANGDTNQGYWPWVEAQVELFPEGNVD